MPGILFTDSLFNNAFASMGIDTSPSPRKTKSTQEFSNTSSGINVG